MKKLFGLLIFASWITPRLLLGTEVEACRRVDLIEHMREMSILVDRIYAGYEDPAQTKDMINLLQHVRMHLAAALTMTPRKLEALSEPQLSIQKMEFQSYLTEVIRLTLVLERQYRTLPEREDQEFMHRREIADTLSRLNRMIGLGHQRFR